MAGVQAGRASGQVSDVLVSADAAAGAVAPPACAPATSTLTKESIDWLLANGWSDVKVGASDPPASSSAKFDFLPSEMWSQAQAYPSDVLFDEWLGAAPMLPFVDYLPDMVFPSVETSLAADASPDLQAKLAAILQHYV